MRFIDTKIITLYTINFAGQPVSSARASARGRKDRIRSGCVRAHSERVHRPGDAHRPIETAEKPKNQKNKKQNGIQTPEKPKFTPEIRDLDGKPKLTPKNRYPRSRKTRDPGDRKRRDPRGDSSRNRYGRYLRHLTEDRDRKTWPGPGSRAYTRRRSEGRMQRDVSEKSAAAGTAAATTTTAHDDGGQRGLYYSKNIRRTHSEWIFVYFSSRTFRLFWFGVFYRRNFCVWRGRRYRKSPREQSSIFPYPPGRIEL